MVAAPASAAGGGGTIGGAAATAAWTTCGWLGAGGVIVSIARAATAAQSVPMTAIPASLNIEDTPPQWLMRDVSRPLLAPLCARGSLQRVNQAKPSFSGRMR